VLGDGPPVTSPKSGSAVHFTTAIRSYSPDASTWSAWRKHRFAELSSDLGFAVLPVPAARVCSGEENAATGRAVTRIKNLNRPFPLWAISHLAVAPSRRDDPQRFIQAIDGVPNCATVGIGHHVPGIIYEVQI
jgi:hypothetical protein